MIESVYFTNNIKIEVQLNSTVKLRNDRENGKIYLLDAKRFYQLLKVGGKKWKIPNRNGGYDQISFNVTRKHLSSAGGGINTYIADYDYESLMFELGISIYSINHVDFENLV